MGKSKLKVALATEKGVDFKKLKQNKKHKERVKKRQERETKNGGAPEDDDDWEGVDEEDEDDVEGGALVSDGEEDDDEEEDEDDEEGEEGEGLFDLEALDESDSDDSSIDLEEKIERPRKSALKAKNAVLNGDKKKEKKKASDDNEKDDEDEDEDEDEEDEDIPMSDLEDLPDDEKEDLVPHSRLTINNTSALLASLSRIAIPTDSSVPFATHQSIAGAEPTADSIEDIQDDLKRELAFYAQSLDAAKRARALLKAEGVPFSRPTDYFAEMVKDDGHMEKVKAKLVEEASAKKASAEARKLRDLKKFGKQVQVAKLQERQKAKRETLEKIKTLKRKRQESSGDIGTNEADLFDVGVDAELSKHSAKKGGPFSRGKDGERAANPKRQKKNDKYGFGGKKRHAKSGDALSSGDLSGFSARKMKAGGGAARPGKKPAKTARLGKSRRKAGAAKR
ncbi:rRNA-processing protein EBP2 [Parahypoxylon ruwenzoriense]